VVSVDETGYRPLRLGGAFGGLIIPAEAPLPQALVKCQLRFSIPNAHERTKASLSHRQIEGISDPYKKVRGYLAGFASYEVFQKNSAVAGTLSYVRKAHTLPVQVVYKSALEFARCH
jgi:hypothetical protein